jgi:hypothetical protein
MSQATAESDFKDDRDFVLRSPECRSREELERALADPIRLLAPPPPNPPPQFSVRDIMLITVGVSVGLAGGSWMPSRAFAFALGLATVLILLVVSFCPPQTHTGKMAWTALLIAYFSALLAAIVRPPFNLP